MIYQLNLPKPSDSLVSLVKEIAYNRPVNYQGQAFHKSVQQPKVNCAAGDFFTDPRVTQLARLEFQKYFSLTLYPTLGIIHNTIPGTLASYAPHTDRIRSIGINYYLESGGDNVTTVFYDQEDPIEETAGGNLLPYEVLNKVNEQKFDINTWYMINTRRFHSVENVERARLMLTLSLLNCTVENLNKLIKDFGTKLSN